MIILIGEQVGNSWVLGYGNEDADQCYKKILDFNTSTV